MSRHLALLFILCTLAVASCQPSVSQTSIRQTQEALTAFEKAVSGAQTQAAEEIPTPIPTATSGPSPTPAPPTPTNPLIIQMKEYLFTAVEMFKPTTHTFHGQLTSVSYLADSNGNITHMDVGLSVSDDTEPSQAYATVLTAFQAIYSNPKLRETVAVPEGLSSFTINLYDLNMKQKSSVNGNWADVVAYGNGSVAPEDFIHGLSFATAEP